MRNREDLNKTRLDYVDLNINIEHIVVTFKMTPARNHTFRTLSKHGNLLIYLFYGTHCQTLLTVNNCMSIICAYVKIFIYLYV